MSPHLRLPSNWPDFLRNSNNKEDLFKMLGAYALTKFTDIQLVTNVAEVICFPFSVMAIIFTDMTFFKFCFQRIKATPKSRTSLSGLSCTATEEADGRIMAHLKDMAVHSAKSVLITTVDSDVVILALSHYFEVHHLGLNELWVRYGSGGSKRIVPIHLIAQHESMGEEKCIAMRGFHAFMGCDTISAFRGKGPRSGWKVWKTFPECTAAFYALAKTEPLSDEVMALLETFVCRLYGASECTSVDAARKELFMTKTKTLNKLPPTSGALLERIKRVQYQAGHIWGQALQVDPEVPSPSEWGWERKEGKWSPKWSSLPSIWGAIRELMKCGCKSGCKENSQCTCRLNRIQCATICTGCKGNCCNSSAPPEERYLLK